MGRKDVRSSYVYTSSRLKVREDKYTLDGTERVYDVVERSDSVVIIPITPTGRTVLLNHFRYPTQRLSVEVPMGGTNEGETSEQAAKRELCEETAIKANVLEHIGRFSPVPGLTAQKVDVYVAKVDDAKLDQASLESIEDDIEGLTTIEISDVYRKAGRGEITDGFTLSSLLLLRLYFENESK